MTGQLAGQSGVRMLAEMRFSLLQNIQKCSGAHPATCSLGLLGVIYMGIKWLGSAVDLSPPSIAEVRCKWDIFFGKYGKMWEILLSTVS